jgi:hypothetical protein
VQMGRASTVRREIAKNLLVSGMSLLYTMK